MELQPHFLFNTLHAISGLMHRDVKVAHEMLVLLADMLNDAVQTVRNQEVTLEEELKTLEPYMQIQQIRFGDRLRVDYDIDGEALGARVPHLIFQPLVENAIKHGIGDLGRTGRGLGAGVGRTPPARGTGRRAGVARCPAVVRRRPHEHAGALELPLRRTTPVRATRRAGRRCPRDGHHSAVER
jgi:hypothetical protein